MNKIELLHRIALNENCVVSIVCPSLSGLRSLWDSSLGIFVLGAKRRNKIEYAWEYPNGSIVLFQNFETVQSCVGISCDYLYTFDNLNGDIYAHLSSRTTKMIFLEITT